MSFLLTLDLECRIGLGANIKSAEIVPTFNNDRALLKNDKIK